jgi:hypothetical protein
MKTIITILLLSMTTVFANGQSSSQLSAINAMSKSQRAILQEALDAKTKAETERVAASDSLTKAQTEIQTLSQNIGSLTNERDGWKARSDWFEKENAKLQGFKDKYAHLSSKVNYASIGIGALVAILAGFLVVFYSGGLAFTAPIVVLAVSGGVGTAVTLAIQLYFRAT